MPHSRAILLLAGVAVALGALAAVSPGPTAATTATAPAGRKGSVAAFQQVASVLRHPRCLNCHPATDFPRQGAERRRHEMNVLRGEDDHGATAMQCSSCHQSSNQKNGVPGAPHWGLAPRSMAWEGLNDHDLAEAIKDRAKNGNRSLEQLYAHIVHDELVGWAWQPGGDRSPVPISREDFARSFREWIDAGAVSPMK